MVIFHFVVLATLYYINLDLQYLHLKKMEFGSGRFDGVVDQKVLDAGNVTEGRGAFWSIPLSDYPFLKPDLNVIILFNLSLAL